MDAASPIPRPSRRLIAIPRLLEAGSLSPGLARAAVLGAIAVSVLVAALVAEAAPHPTALGDPALTRLLRAMAVIKAGMAAAVVGAIVWRLGVGARPILLGAYAAAGAAMAAGPVLIWGMTNLVSGALLLHGGLLTGALILWRDPATTDRLKSLIAARRLASR